MGVYMTSPEPGTILRSRAKNSVIQLRSQVEDVEDVEDVE